MSKAAKEIRRQVAEGLRAAGTRAGERVFANRTRPIWKDDPPVILIYTGSERPITLRNASPKIYLRALELAIVVADVESSDPTDSLDDRLDDLGDVVEWFIFRDPLLGLGERTIDDDGYGGFEIDDTLLESVELVQFKPEDGREPERALAGQRITFSVRYLAPATEGRSEDGQPFRGADIEWRLKPGDDLVDARDRVDLSGS